MTWVEVKVPPALKLEEQPAVSEPTILSPIILNGDPPNVFHTEVIYTANTIPADDSNPIIHPVSISYEGQREPFGSGWIINVALGNDFSTVLRDFVDNGIGPADYLFLRQMELRMVIGDETWNPPGGVFDPEVLVEPGTFTNVENGFGYVGAGYVASVRWRPDRRPMLLAGFANCRPLYPNTICTKADLEP
jgi:hypothetical protein